MGQRPFGMIVSAGLVLALGLPAAAGPKSEDKVKIAAQADKPDADGNQTVTLTLEVEKDWHLYANPVNNPDLEEAKTVVAFGKPEAARVFYPEGRRVKDKVLGDYSTYEGKVIIRAQVRRARGDTAPLEVSIKLQACNDIKGQCLEPSTAKITVP